MQTFHRDDLKSHVASQHQLRKIYCILINAVPMLTVDQADALIRGKSILKEEIGKMFLAISPSSVINADNHSDERVVYWKTLIVEELDKLETAFPLALQIAENRQCGNGKVRQEDLAEVLNCSHPTIGKVFRNKDSWKEIPGWDRICLIKEELSKEFPQRWINLRGKDSPFSQYF